MALPAKDKTAYVGVDLGGTSIFAAVVAPDGKASQVLGKAKIKTDAELGAIGVTARISNTIDMAIERAGLKRKQIRGVGVGVPGPIDPETGLVFRCANLGPTWDNFSLGDTLGDQINLPVTIDNDVNVGALGEYHYGAGRGTRDMLAIFVGTGIGGGLILRGKLRSGVRNSAGEVGHMVVLADGPLCGCGERGHAEALASRTAMERDIRAGIEAGQPSIIPQLLQEQARSMISAGIIGDAYDAGDTLTIEVVQKAQYYLGLLVSACVNLLDPEAIVVGGGILERMGEAYLDPVRQVAVQHYLNKSHLDRIRIVRAALGDFPGALGAAILAKERLG
jgi:glucokinase